MDVIAYLRILRRHWRMIAAAAVLGALVGAATTVFSNSTSDASGGQGTSYFKATHTLFLDTSAVNGASYRPVYTNLDQMAVLATTGDVPARVADEVGGDPKDLTTHLYISTHSTLSTIDLSVAERDPRTAVKVADAFAAALIESIKAKEQTRFDQLRDDTLQRLDQLQGQIAALDAQIAATPLDQRSILTAQRNSLVNSYTSTYEKFQGIANAGDPTSNLSTLQAAQAERISKREYTARLTAGELGRNIVRADIVSSSPDTTDELASTETSGTRLNGPLARGVLGALLGLLIGVGLALVADRIDRRVRTREEFEMAYGMPVLAELPLLKSSEQRSFELTVATAPLSRSAEAYRAVRSSLLFQRPTTRGQLSTKALTVMVASATPKEGKSTTSANLAAVFAESGQRVLVMNCDFRRPTLHRFFGVENEPRRVLESGIDGLMLVADVTGPENPNPAYITDQQRRIITNSQEHFEVVILDTAPLLSTNDATELMDLVDLVLVVGRVGQSTSDNAARIRELLARLDASVAGVVMVGSDAATNDYYYYYSRGRAKELAQSSAAPDTARDATRRNGSGNGSNGPRDEGEMVKPTTAPEQSDG